MKQYHHGNLRDALIERAVEVIHQGGVEGLSLRRIAKDLGVSHAAPARHFKNKAGLLSAILNVSLKELTQTIFKKPDEEKYENAIVELNIMAHRTIKWALNNKAKFSVMINPDVSRYADEALTKSMGEFVASLSGTLKEAQKTGFRPNASDEALLIYAIGAPRGIAAALTDELISSVLGAQENEQLIKELANQIVPLSDV